MSFLFENRKGQTILTVIFMSIVFLFVWIMFAGRELSRWGQQAILNGNLTGVEAFGFANLNLLVGVAFLVFFVVVASVR